jgi:hypothetical protein
MTLSLDHSCLHIIGLLFWYVILYVRILSVVRKFEFRDFMRYPIHCQNGERGSRSSSREREREHHTHFEKDGKMGMPENTHACAMQAKLYDKAAIPVPTAVKVIAFLLVN